MIAEYNTVRKVSISADKAGQRIDNFLFTLLKGVPKSHIYRILRAGEVRVNKKRVKPDYRLQAEDILRIPPVRHAPETPIILHQSILTRLKQAILYEDDNLLVLNKPSGMAVHGGSGLSFGVIEALRQQDPKQTYELVHRLDRETSGCLLVAKKNSALRELHRALREHEITKTYYALVRGHWPKRLQKIDMSLHKNQLQSGERMVRVSEQGKTALTHFQVEKCYATASLIKARLITGRTHQIRVHTAYAQHPIAGDEKYGDKNFNKDIRWLGLKRLFLHAYELRLCLPGSTTLRTFTAPLDDELKHVLQSL